MAEVAANASSAPIADPLNDFCTSLTGRRIAQDFVKLWARRYWEWAKSYGYSLEESTHRWVRNRFLCQPEMAGFSVETQKRVDGALVAWAQFHAA